MSDTCDICGRQTSTDPWCATSMCPAFTAGRHPGMDVAIAACYRIGRERVMAERDALSAERDALLQRVKEAEAMVAQVVSLEKCSIDETESKLTLASRTLQVLLSAWGDLLIANKARNFLCVDFVHDELGIVHVTVQLDSGETPVQQRDYWRERAEKAEVELDRIAAAAGVTP